MEGSTFWSYSVSKVARLPRSLSPRTTGRYSRKVISWSSAPTSFLASWGGGIAVLWIFKKMLTSKMNSSLACADKSLVLVSRSHSPLRLSTILLCSWRKRVCMEVRPGCTTALVSPLVRSFGVGFGFRLLLVFCGLPKPHWPLLGKDSWFLLSFWVFKRAPGMVVVLPCSPATLTLSLRPMDVSSSDP